MKRIIARCFIIALLVATTGCGGGGGGDGLFTPDSCSDTPRINSTPFPTATAGQQYSYVVVWYHCFLCTSILPVRLPPGASVSGSGIYWTPSANDINRNVPFAISTPSNACGESARQSWSVAVFAPPVIQSFTASAKTVSPGNSVTLTAVFQGNGQIEGIGPVSSGVPITTAPLSTSTSFALLVTNNAGAQAVSLVRVEVPGVPGPPIILSFAASPVTIGVGASSTLSWSASGEISQAVISPLGTDVLGASTLVVSPVATTSYVLQLSNAGGQSASASVQVEVVPSASIQGFAATPSSISPGGVVTLSATFQGTGSVQREINSVYSMLGAINSGGTLDSGTILRTTGFRLVVLNALGAATTQDLVVPVTGPGSFQAAKGLPIRPTRSYHTATRLADGRVFIAGGEGDNSDFPNNTTEIFDPVTESFSPGPTLLSGRFHHSAALLADGRVLISGARPYGLVPADRTAEIYDPITRTVAPLGVPSDVIFAEGGPSLALLDGRVVVNVYKDPFGLRIAGAVIFDPITSTFGGFLPFAVQTLMSAAILLPGGTGLFISGQPQPSALFSPASNSFASTGRVINFHGTDFLASSLLDGRVMVIGGTADPGTPPEIYNPSTGLFSALGPGFVRRYGSAATLANGKVLIAGGAISDRQPWAELYDPVTNAFSATGGLRRSRLGHTATLLLDGRVLIEGGCTALPCEAEIYTAE